MGPKGQDSLWNTSFSKLPEPSASTNRVSPPRKYQDFSDRLVTVCDREMSPSRRLLSLSYTPTFCFRPSIATVVSRYQPALSINWPIIMAWSAGTEFRSWRLKILTCAKKTGRPPGHGRSGEQTD